ncbi:MAG: transcription factor [Halobacteriales archaeon SW_9_67_25]|nr:MAG: transcription factor [Halobacteriales archaeon SW_9_67_25]
MAFEELLEDPVIQKYLHELVGPKGMPVAAAPPDGEGTESYRRLRDEDSGWLTYLWTFEYDKVPEQLEEEMHRLLAGLDERREYEQTHEFYLCENCGIRFEFGEAMDVGFECPQCGSGLETMENTRLVDAMEERIGALRDELNVESVDVEG